MQTEAPRAYPSRWLLPLMTLGLVLGVALSLGADAWPLPAAALTLSLAAALLFPGRRRVLALMLAAAALGSLLTIRANHPALPPEGTYVISGVVLDEIVVEENGHLQTVLGSATLNGEPISGKLWWTTYLSQEASLPVWIKPGVRVAFSGEVYHPKGQSNPGGYDFRLHLLSDGVTLGVYGHDSLRLSSGSVSLQGSMAALRHRITRTLRDVMGEESGALAAAMLLGAKDDLPEENYAAFKALGIVHILSVSGYHVGVLVMLLGLLLKPLPRAVRYGAMGVVLALYALLTGAAPPVIRAGLLVLLCEGGRLQHRRNLKLHLLCLTAAGQLLINPLQLFNASFLLSYSAMLGLLILYPRLRSACLFTNRWLNLLWQSEMLCISAQLGMLPVQLHFFGSFAPATFVMNPLVILFSSGVMSLYWAMLLLLPVPGLRDVLGAFAGQATEGLLAAIRFLADALGGYVYLPAPNLLTVLGWAMLLLGLGILLGHSRTALRRTFSLCGAALIVLSMLRLPHTDVAYMQFSDGEADAALLHDRDTVILIDAGESPAAVPTYLRDHGLAVDMLILTHLHIDHAGGIEGLLNLNIPVRVCALPAGAMDAGDVDEAALALLAGLADAGTQFITLSRGDVIHTPSGQLTVVWPQAGAIRPGLDANDASLVLRADILGTTLLLAADLTSRYEMYAAAPADVLKAGHHGSLDSTGEAFLSAVDPQLILLSCGRDDREDRFLPRTGDIPVCSTHSHGCITLRFTQDAFTVETFLPR